MPQRKGGGKRDSLSRGPDQWGMGKERKKATYKYFWIKGNEVTFTNLFENNENEDNSLPDSQFNNSITFIKNGG